MQIGAISREYLSALLEKKERIDKRDLMSYREISISTGTIPHAEGSASVRLGYTYVLAGVKLDVGEPMRDKPDEGALTTMAELLPLASENYEEGPPSPEAVEFARVVDRGIRAAEIIDMASLFIEQGKVWNTYLDIYVLNYDGNLFDAGTLAGVAALLTCRMPKLEGKEVIREGNLQRLKTKGIVTSCTFAKINDTLLLDPNGNEETFMNARLTIANDEKKIRAMQKGLSGYFTVDEIERLIDISFEKSKLLRSAIKKATGD
ncbi:MAG: exosome complex protein Rrp42 [Candidatus Micrarchaeaceae archaeon]